MYSIVKNFDVTAICLLDLWLQLIETNLKFITKWFLVKSLREKFRMF